MLEVAVAEHAAVVERDEVRLRRVRPQAPVGPVGTVVLAAPRLIGVREPRERVQRVLEIGPIREGDEVERRRAEIRSGGDVELGDHVPPHLVVPLARARRDLRRARRRPTSRPVLSIARERPTPRASALVDRVEPHLRVRQVLEPGDRLHVHRPDCGTHPPEGGRRIIRGADVRRPSTSLDWLT